MVFEFILFVVGLALLGGIVGRLIVKEIAEPIEQNLGFWPAAIISSVVLIVYVSWTIWAIQFLRFF